MTANPIGPRRFAMPRWLFCLLVILIVGLFLTNVALSQPKKYIPARYAAWVFQHWDFNFIVNLIAWNSLVQLVLMGLVWRHLVRRYSKHKGLRVIAQREAPFSACETWSTHLGSPILKSIWWRILRLIPFVKSAGHFSALKNDADRDIVNALSLQAFEDMLIEHHAKQGVLIISTSLLNRRNRSATRLQQRIDAVARQPGWQAAMVVREIGFSSSFIARFLFGWKSVLGEQAGRFLAPGIVAWRSEDGDLIDAKWRARLARLHLRIANDADLKSPVFLGVPYHLFQFECDAMPLGLGVLAYKSELLNRCVRAAKGNLVLPHSQIEADVWRAAALVLGRQYSREANNLWRAFETYYETHRVTGEPATYAQLEQVGLIDEPSQYQDLLSKLLG